MDGGRRKEKKVPAQKWTCRPVDPGKKQQKPLT